MLDTILSIPAFLGSLLAIAVGLALIAAARWRSQVMGLWLPDGVGSLLTLLGWIASLAGAMYAFLFLAGWAGLGLWFALLVVLAMAITRRRAGQRQALFRLLAAATK